MRREIRTIVAVMVLGAAVPVLGGALPQWTTRIRSDHPRLFFNRDTWPAVRARALGPEAAWYRQFQARVDRLKSKLATTDRPEAEDLGQEAAWSAFVFLMTEDAAYLDLAAKCLETSIRYYERCFTERKSVNWYSTSRVHAVLAWDWLYDHLDPAQRRDFMLRLIRVIDRVLHVKPPIYRENMSGYSTGFYGVRNCLWFIGCTAFGTGIEPELVNDWLVRGHDENLRLLEHRRQACGDDGGGASATLGYVFGAYPWAEQNFFYTWLSNTGQNIAPDWPHSALLANYVIWNWIAADPAPLEFGYGDTPHTRNTLPTSQLYTHMANIRHLFGQADPRATALARHLQQKLPKQSYATTWFIYPFLLTQAESSPQPFYPDDLPHARHFQTMGQVFMRSGTGPQDSYCLFSCGGILRQHRHYDALNFVIYHRGFLALDSGTRYKEFDNGEHLANYYAQTVAHNCILIHQPGEPPARYWGGTVTGNHGGQHRQLGSVVKAFETRREYVYVAGDATKCYLHGSAKLPEKCRLLTRQLVFLLPNHFVVFDRVETTDAAYRKQWLIHTAHEPAITGRTIRADHNKGRMYCRTLLPEDAVLTPVGGPGKEFWAAGKNWDIATDGLTAENLALMGQWRVEVTPNVARRTDLFLHVIQVGDQQLTPMDKTELVRESDVCGVRVDAGGRTWEVTFNVNGPLAGHIRRRGADAIDRPLATTVQSQSGI